MDWQTGAVKRFDGETGAFKANFITGLTRAEGFTFGPDGLLYITNGSTCDECVETDVRAATILTANPDGTNLTVYASGLRNPYDIAFDSQGRLWATDNGSDGVVYDDTNDEIEVQASVGLTVPADACVEIQFQVTIN